MLSLQNQISWFKRVQWSLICGTLAAAGTFYWFVYRPKVQRMDQLRSEIASSEKELAGSRNKTSVLPSVVAEVDQLKQRVGRFKTVSRPQEAGLVHQEMEEILRQSSLKNVNYQEDPAGIGRMGGKLSGRAVQISFEGDFNSIYSFLRRTDDLQRLTRIPTLIIKSRDRHGMVKVAMRMNIYFQGE